MKYEWKYFILLNNEDILHNLVEEKIDDELLICCDVAVAKSFSSTIYPEICNHSESKRVIAIWPSTLAQYCHSIEAEEELKKFKPSLEVEDIEDAVYQEEMTDVMDLLNKVMDQQKN